MKLQNNTRSRELKESIHRIFEEYNTGIFKTTEALTQATLEHLEENSPDAKKFLETAENTNTVLAKGEQIILPYIDAYLKGEPVAPPVLALALFKENVFKAETDTKEKVDIYKTLVNSFLMPLEKPSVYRRVVRAIQGKKSYSAAFKEASDKVLEAMLPTIIRQETIYKTFMQGKVDTLNGLIGQGKLKKMYTGQKTKHK